MDTEDIIYVVGFCIGLICGAFIMDRVHISEELLRACEKSLPREQECKLTAVPEEK